MSIPLLILGGTAGSGKSTAAKWFEENEGAVVVGLADPIKRFVAEAFPGFSYDNLWGPSEFRNEIPATYNPTLSSDRMRRGWNTLEDKIWGFITGSFPPELENRATIKFCDWKRKTWKEYRENGLSSRHLLQTLGTDWGRDGVSKQLWIDIAIETAFNLFGGGYTYDPQQGLAKSKEEPPARLVVIPDGRYANEVIKVKSVGGEAWVISAASPEYQIAPLPPHSSEELDIPSTFWDRDILNDGGDAFFNRLSAATINSSLVQGPAYVH